MDVSRTVIVSLCLLLVAGEVKSYCDVSGLLSCMKPLQQFSSKTGGLAGTYDRKTITNLCKKMTNVTDCARKKTATCTGDETLIWVMMEKGFGYLCGEGFEGFMANAECFVKQEVNVSVKECTKNQVQQLHSVIYNEYSKDKTYKETCKVLGKYRICLNENIKKYCNQDAANVMVKMLDLMLEPLKKKMDCQKGFPTGAIIAIVVGICALLVVIVFIYNFVRKRKADAINYQRFENGPSMQPSGLIPEQQFSRIEEPVLRTGDHSEMK